jgi:hypothetical protein
MNLDGWDFNDGGPQLAQWLGQAIGLMGGSRNQHAPTTQRFVPTI